MKRINAILTEIDHLNRIAVEYSKHEYERYKKLHPQTQKKPTDPLFALKGTEGDVKKPNEQKTTTLPIKKNDHFSIFNQTPETKLVPAKSIQALPQSAEVESFTRSSVNHILSGKYQKKEPLSVFRVNKTDGSHYYSLRSDHGTFQALKNQGWDHLPVKEVKQVDEKDLTSPKSKDLSEDSIKEISETLKKRTSLGQSLESIVASRKDAIAQHLKKEAHELSTAGKAISKFLKRSVLTSDEKEAVDTAARKIGSMVISMALGGHVGLSDLAEHFAAEVSVESATAKKENKHELDAFFDDDTKNQPLNEKTITKIDFKGLGKKVKDVFNDRKEALVHHLKNEVHSFKNSGVAISKFISGKEVSQKERAALADAAKDIALAVTLSALGGHLAVAGVLKYLAIGAVSTGLFSKNPRVSSLLTKLEVLMKKSSNKDDIDIFIEMVVDHVVKELTKVEKYTPEQIRELAKKIKQSAEHDPKVRKTFEEEFKKK